MSIEVLERGTVYLGEATPSSGGGSVPAVIESLSVTPTTSSQTIIAPEGVDGYSPVNVSAVTSSIDANITAENIKSGVDILGVTGNLKGADIITALNNTGTAVSEGDKVWINQEAAYSYNFDVVGTPTIDNTTEVVSGFSTSNYLRLTDSFDPGNNTWEIVFKFKPYSVHDGCLMTKISYGADYGFRIEPVQSGKIYYLISSSSGQTYLFEGVGDNDYVVNEWNWVKFEFTGSAYNAYISSDGVSWTLDKTYSSSTVLYSFSANTNIGNHTEKTGYTLDGEIDLSASYIKINNTNWWVPNFTKLADNKLEDYDYYNTSILKTGTPTISNDIVSGFSKYDYVTSTQNLNISSSTPWEIGCSFMLKNSSGGGYVYSFGQYYSGPYLTCTSSSFSVALGNGSAWIGDIASVSTSTYNQKVWTRLVYDGNGTYCLYWSTDGENFTKTTDVSLSGITINYPIHLGQCYSNVSPFVDGEIYLRDCYFKVSGVETWRGAKTNYILAPNTALTGVAKENIASGSTGQVETILPEA